MSDYIPEELFPTILLGMTAEDLVRCTAVCKKWYSLIRSPNFVALHVNKSQQEENRNRILVKHCTVLPHQAPQFHYSVRTKGTFQECKRLNFPLEPGKDLRVLGFANGLVCFSKAELSLLHVNFIWNPLVRKAIRVPEPNFTYRFEGRFPSMHCFGFGFDSSTNDYKIVKVLHFDYLDSFCNAKVEVYSVRIGCWRIISERAPKHLIRPQSEQVYVRGAAHWLAYTSYDSNYSQNLISVFDMRDEIFREVPMPESLLRAADFSSRGELFPYECDGQESLSLLHFIRNGQSLLCTVWVMKEYGEAESWVNQYTIDCNGGWGSPVGMRPNGEVLVVREDNLFSYDCEDNKFSDLAIRGGPAKHSVCAYTESLVLLDKGAEFNDAVIFENHLRGGRVD